MKHNLLNVLIFITTIGLFSCSGEEKTNLPFTNNILNIDLEDTSSVLASNFFEKVDYIPLEETEESMIGEITKMEVTDKHFIIMDKITNCLFFFSLDGQFVKKVSAIAQNGDTLFNKIGDFSVDFLNKQIKILDSYQNKIVNLTASGDFISSSSIPVAIHNFFINASYSYIYKNYANNNKTKSFNVVAFDPNLKKVQEYFEYDPSKLTREEMFATRQNFYRSGQNAYFLQPFTYTIYELNKTGSLIPAFYIKIPNRYTMPDDFLTNENYDNNRKNFFMSQNKQGYNINKNKENIVWSCSDIFVTQDSFITLNLNSMKRPKKTLIYNYKKRKAQFIEFIYSDTSTNSLPIMENDFLASDGIHLYAHLSSKLMMFAKLHIPIENNIPNKKLVKYLNNVTTKSNPVISKLKIR